MAVTPFHHVPKVRFAAKIALPAVWVFFLSWHAMGVIAKGAAVREQTPTFRGLASQSVPEKAQAGEAARIHFENFVYTLANLPEVCTTGEMVNDLQRRQCSEFWGNLLVAGLVALSPFGAAALFGFFALDSLNLVYRRARRRIEKGKVAYSARVGERPGLKNDAWGWIYCLRPIRVQVNGGKTLKVYIPEADGLPKAGDTVAIFESGKAMGEMRYFGMVYTPHVAIVRGSN